MMSKYGIGNVREIGGGWELSWRPVETFDSEVVGVPIIRPYGGDWIELPAEVLDGLAQWSADVRDTMRVGIEIMNSCSSRS
ncbi:hypothetical protein [Rhodococcus rhodochrous]|uniref:Uncharacterized protein n=1 Tax=Rhodococcus rhodochrous TaxID=1829 RepID=A0AA46WS56_RHORH|nr:hypothetical protein [Rhodococcus rhodochrous]UZF43187.1 hypothetical protein KUM34_014835 [Rhodococcus rhodochrous]